MIVRIAAVQYLLRQIHDWSGFENQVRFIMKAAGDYKPQFVVLPEIFTTQLLSFMDTADVHAAVRNMHDYTARYKALMQELAAQWDVHLIGGSHPTLHEDGRLLNTAYYFTPGGEIYEQDKIHRTRWEREKWNTDAGDQLHLFETPFGKIAILICYDIEFPELSRMVCEAGADILFVPSCTDDRQGFLRVRYCCHARAIENQVFVVHTSTVGNLPVEGLGHALRPGGHHHAVGLPVRARRHRRRGHAQHRADHRRRSRSERLGEQPHQGHDDPALRQAQGHLRAPCASRQGEVTRARRARANPRQALAAPAADTAARSASR